MAGSSTRNPVLKAYNDGKRDGRLEVRKEILDFLEKKYMDPNVVRGTPLAEGLLDIVRELSLMMK